MIFRIYFKIMAALVVAIVAGCGAKTMDISVAQGKLSTQIGVASAQTIQLSGGKIGYFVFGPYINLEPGTYRVVAKGLLDAKASPAAVMDVVSERGNHIWATRPIYISTVASGGGNEGVITSVIFDVDKPVTDAEFRIQVLDPSATGVFSNFELTKISSR